MKQKLTFKNFLTEAIVKDSKFRKKTLVDSSNLDSADLKKIFNLLKKNCPSALKALIEKDQCIYRGMSDGPSVMEVNYSKGTRKAENTADYYRLLIDTNPEFRHLPKRGKSLIASTKKDYAAGYGIPYLVFPYEETEIGVVPESDIFDITFNFFDAKEVEVDKFSLFLDGLFKRNMDAKSKQSKLVKTGYITLDEFKRNITTIGMHSLLNYMQQKGVIDNGEMTVEQFNKKYMITDADSFVQYIWSKILCQQNLNFKVGKPLEFFSSIYSSNREVWISNKCIVIKDIDLRSNIKELTQLYNNSANVTESTIFDTDVISVEEAAKIINERCGEWKKYVGDLGVNILYRGMRERFSPDIVMKWPRTNRRPLSTERKVHDFADDYLNKNFGVKFRSSSIFTSRDIRLAKYYGDAYAIFPLDRVSFAWSKDVEDFTVAVDDFTRAKSGTWSEGEKLEINDKQWKEFMDSLNYHCNDDSLKEFYFKYQNLRKHEVMVHCDDYLAIRHEVLNDVIKLLD